MAQNVEYRLSFSVDGKEHVIEITDDVKQLAEELGIANKGSDEVRNSLLKINNINEAVQNASQGIQEHVKGKVTPERLLSFPWDSSGLGHGNHRAETKKTSPRPVSKEEDRKRFEALMKRIG